MARRRRTKMTPRELGERIKHLPSKAPLAESLRRTMSGDEEADLGSEMRKNQFVNWLAGYDGPGYYGRLNWNRSAEFAYNHMHSASALMWLAEAAGVPRFALEKAMAEVLGAEPNMPSQAAALRRVLPWALVEALLRAR
jgi:hypothetical protein